jgi:uncharacterized membrane protein
VDIYTLFKFLHVVAVIVWIGGVVTLNILGARIAREHDGPQLASLGRHAAFYGRAVLGPAAATTLVAGIVMVAVGGLSLATPWIAWGLGMVLLSLLLGATLIRSTTQQLSTVAPADPTGPRVLALRRRAATLSLINLALLLSAVAAMVFKPAL